MIRQHNAILAGNSGCTIAALIGLLTVATTNGAAALFGHAHFNLREEWGVFAFQAAIAAAPFALLATLRNTQAGNWLITAALTVLMWGAYLLDILTLDGRGGANIGMGLLLLFSPILIAIGTRLILWPIRAIRQR